MHAFGAIYNLVSIASGLASYVCSVVLASAVYEAAKARGAVNCVGPDCYRFTFLALGGMCAVGGGAAAWALHRTTEAKAARARAAAAAATESGTGAV